MGLIKIYPSARLHSRIDANAKACVPKKKIGDYVVELLEKYTPRTITFVDEPSQPADSKGGIPEKKSKRR